MKNNNVLILSVIFAVISFAVFSGATFAQTAKYLTTQEIQNIVKQLKISYSIGEFYSERFYEADDSKIAEIIFKEYNESDELPKD